MLQALGIDPFSDEKFDTWVIRTIQVRINDNQRGSSDGDGKRFISINPLYSLFNHSCVPNVVCSNPDNGSTVTMRAIIDIRNGHELLISYLDDDLLDLPLAERQKLLFNWFGGESVAAVDARWRRYLDKT